MREYAIALFMVLLAIPVNAGLLSINDHVQDGYIIDNGTRYRVLDDSNVFVQFLNNGFTSYRRIIVENADIVDELNKTASNLLLELESLNNQIASLKSEINSSKEMKKDAETLLASLEEQRDKLKAQLDEILEKKEEYENMITGGAIFSATGFWLTIIVFIILLLIVLFLKFYGKKEKNNKTNSISFSGNTIEGVIIGYPHHNKSDNDNSKLK